MKLLVTCICVFVCVFLRISEIEWIRNQLKQYQSWDDIQYATNMTLKTYPGKSQPVFQQFILNLKQFFENINQFEDPIDEPMEIDDTGNEC